MKTREKKRIGERLAIVRGSVKMSQKELSEVIGLPWRTYQKYETGVSDVSAEFLIKFSREFSVRPEWIMFGEGGIHALSQLDDLKFIIIQIEEILHETGCEMASTTKAEIVVRLLRKRIDGHRVEPSDVRDFIEIATQRI